MSLNKMSKGSYTYYELFMSCPVCQSRGRNTPQTFWQHHGCGGKLYVGDNAYYNCKKCNQDTHVKEWKYGCPTHSNGTDLEFISATGEGIAATIAVAGQLVSEAGLPWLQKFLENLGEF